MSDWKVLIADGLEESGITILEEFASVDDRKGISREDLLQIIPDYHAMIVRSRTKVNEEVFNSGKNLKVVGRAGVGVDNIDLSAARNHKVAVVNAPTGSTIAVAELTFGLLLSMIRDIQKADSSMKSGNWIKKELMGFELYGKTLGIVGFGRIGMALAERARGFGMTVIACDKFVQPEVILEQGITPICEDEFYEMTDIISLHVPLTEDTRGMLNKDTFARMKDGVRIICAARGGVIDEDDLLVALNSGKVAGAALDVFAKEPPGASSLVQHPHVIATPHIGAQTYEAQLRTANDIAAEVLAALRGDPLRWKIV